MSHDSLQMKFEDIVDVVSALGTVKGIKVLRSAMQHDARHDKRLRALCQQLKVSELDVERLSSPRHPFVAVYDLIDRRLRDVGALPEGTVSPTDIAYRNALAKLNYTFMASNAQNLPANVQFRDDDYLPVPHPLFSLAEVLARMAVEPTYFFMNLSVLLEAHSAKVYELPEPIMTLARAINVRPGSWREAIGDQAANHQLFLRQVPSR